MKKTILALAALLALAGCEEHSPASIPLRKLTAESVEIEPKQQAIVPGSGRFDVQRADVFRDDLAYADKRGIYILTDRETGKEYVGISGIGISELGSHKAGKSTRSDER
jgi:hypothetical protein